MRSIHSPEVIAKARACGITDLQALDYFRQRDALRNKYQVRNPNLLLVERVK